MSIRGIRTVVILLCMGVLIGVTIVFSMQLYSEPALFGIAILSSAIILGPPVLSYLRQLKGEVFEPSWVIAITYFTYIVISPLYHVATRQQSFLGHFYSSDDYIHGIIISSIAVISLWFGYYFPLGRNLVKKIPCPEANTDQTLKLSLMVGIIALASLLIWCFTNSIPLSNLLLPGILSKKNNDIDFLSGNNPYLLLIGLESWLSVILIRWTFLSKKKLKILDLLCVLFVFLVYTSYGARYRLLLLFGSLFVLYFLKRKKRPKAIVLFILLSISIIGFSWIGDYRWQARNGIELDTSNFSDSFMRHLRLIEPFISVLKYVPTYAPFEHGKSFLYTFILPIPHSIWKGKPDPGFRDILESSIGSSNAYNSGLFYPNYGEYYQNFGLIGIIFFMFIFGLICRLVFEWYTNNKAKQWAMIFYALYLPFIVQVISRGYFAQIIQEIILIFGPAITVALMSQSYRRDQIQNYKLRLHH